MPTPCDIPGVSKICDAVGDAASSVAGSAFQSVVDAFAKGLADVMKALMTFWVHMPDPDVGGSSPVVSQLNSLTRPLVAFAAVVGLVIAGVRLAWTARQDHQSAQAILRGLLLMAVVTGGGATIVALLLSAFDEAGVWILDHGMDGKSVGDRLILLGTLPGNIGGGLEFLLAFLGMLAGIVQCAVMLIRGAILAVLVGILPIAAAASVTDTGYAWFKRLCGWIAAFTLYKLTAGIIYAAAFLLIGNGTDLASVVSGFGLMIVAILALPALLRLLPPASEAMGGSGGGAMAGMVGAAATGSVALAGLNSSSSTPPATAAPGLKGSAGPSGSAGSAGSSAAGKLPAGGSGGAADGAAAGGGATGGAAVAVLSKVHAAAKAGANGAVGSDGQ